MRIMAVCGSGLGSSFMLEMNIQDVLKELNVADVTVNHTDLSSASSDMADVFIAGRDIAESMGFLGKVIVLNNILDKEEIKTKLQVELTEFGVKY